MRMRKKDREDRESGKNAGGRTGRSVQGRGETPERL